MLDAIEAVKEKMVLACKVLQKQRVLDGYGHLTARLSDGRILSTPHMPPGKVALRDLIIIDAEGNKLEGFGELFRALSFAEIGPAAMLSRAAAGSIGQVVVFTLPGSPAGVRLALERLILPELPHIVSQLRRTSRHEHHRHV